MNLPLTPLRFLKRASELYRDKTGVVYGDERYTYHEFHQQVNQFSNMLRAAGTGEGDTVAFLGLNDTWLLASYYAVPRLGAILLPMNVRLKPSDFAFIFNDAGVKTVIAGQMFAPAVDAVRDQLETVEHFLCIGDDVPEGWEDFRAAVSGASEAEPPAVDIDENQPAELFYTSGTTGRPKGVIMTHRNLYLHAMQVLATEPTYDSDVHVVGTVPLFHVNAWGSPHILTAAGARQVIVPKFDVEPVYKVVQEEQATIMYLVPTMLNMLVNHPTASEQDLSSLRTIMIGGAPPPPSLIRAAREMWGIEVKVGYGLTETMPVLTIANVKETLSHLSQDEQDKRQAMTGMPVIGIDLEILDDQGQPLPHDGEAIGEVAVRGDSVTPGYLNRPEENAKAFRYGWFLTGDMATIDSEGYLQIVDRKKDIIISGGENISSVEIEEVLYEHPAVLEAAVIAVPDDQWGEVPQAIVRLGDGQSAGPDELIAYCREHLPGFKVPKQVIIREDELPKTGTGKIEKNTLREPYWQDKERRIN